jgi:hypothetical protein
MKFARDFGIAVVEKSQQFSRTNKNFIQINESDGQSQHSGSTKVNLHDQPVKLIKSNSSMLNLLTMDKSSLN